MTIEKQKQLLTPGRRVELFEFDARKVGGDIFYFVSSFVENQPLMWQGNSYVPFPVRAEGFELTGRGSLPQPKLTLSNVTLFFSAIVNSIGDPIGARVTRWVTYADFLDDGATPDPEQHFFPSIFVVNRKSAQTKMAVEFELSASMDQQGRQLPGRQILRDTCTHTYRIFNVITQSFDMAKATCPYMGRDNDIRPYFKADGSQTANADEDICGKKLSDCKLRFGRDPAQVFKDVRPLPTRAFPSVARTR